MGSDYERLRELAPVENKFLLRRVPFIHFGRELG